MGNFIRNIDIQNFKSIQHQKIDECKRINVFIGYPNVGKSNILEAIGLYSLREINDSSFYFDQICRVKHFSELFYNQQYRKKSTIGINNRYKLTLDNTTKSNTLHVDIIDNQITDEERSIRDFLDNTSTTNQTVHLYETSDNNITLKVENHLKFNSVKKYHFENDAPVHLLIGNALSLPSGKNLLDVLQREPLLRKDLSEILKSYNLKLLLDTSSESIMFIKELEDGSVLRIPYHQVADTLKRLTFYKAAIRSNLNTVLLFEEPEAHMFPPYISKFSNDIIHDENNNQYFLTTHSHFVLNDFMEDARDDLSVYIIGYNKGETTIKKLSDEELHNAYQYGVDLFLNMQDYEG